jgi:hypothetical protein
MMIYDVKKPKRDPDWMEYVYSFLAADFLFLKHLQKKKRTDLIFS